MPITFDTISSQSNPNNNMNDPTTQMVEAIESATDSTTDSKVKQLISALDKYNYESLIQPPPPISELIATTANVAAAVVAISDDQDPKLAAVLELINKKLNYDGPNNPPKSLLELSLPLSKDPTNNDLAINVSKALNTLGEGNPGGGELSSLLNHL